MKNGYINMSMICLALIHGTTGFGQYYNQTDAFLKANSHWIFGTNAGLDFSSGTAVPVQTVMDAHEGPVTVSDPVTGDLLFYSNGQDCRNANGMIMPNGDSLLGNSLLNTNSSSTTGHSTAQGTCVIPVIGDPDKFYLFSMVGMSMSQPNYTQGSLFYSVVNMSLEGGLGDIEAGMKNIPLNYDILSEAMIAIPGDNCDIWLMVHDSEEPEFLAYHITREGIDTTPVVSTAGIAGSSAVWGDPYWFARMAISPDRQKIAIAGNDSLARLIAHFDPATGIVSDATLYSLGSGDLCFSPDNSKLYSVEDNSIMYQFDVSVWDSTTIASSIVNIPIAVRGDLRLYNDTIYMGKSVSVTSPNSFDRINQPNMSGIACDLESDAIVYLPNTWGGGIGMGNDVVFPMPPDTFINMALDTMVCSRLELALTLSPADRYELVEWSDGSIDSTLDVTQAGVYWALQTDGCHYYVDSFILEAIPFPEPVITINVLELGTVVTTYASYQWMLNGSIIPNATQPTYTVSENGDYQVIVTNAEGCIDTSEVYKVTNTAIDEIRSLAGKITTYPNPVKNLVHINTPVPLNLTLVNLEGKTLKSYERSNMVSMEGLAEGVYFLKLYDQGNRLIKTEKIIKVR